MTGPEMLIDAAARLFERKGYQNTTIDDIAQAVGIAKPTVYQHVKSKGWLLDKISESVLARLKSDLDAVSAIDEPAAQVPALIKFFIASVHDLQPYFLIFMGEERELSPATRKRFRAWAREITDSIAGILDNGRQAGVVRADVDPQIAANFIIGMLTSVARWYDPNGRLSPEELEEVALSILSGYILDPRTGRRRSTRLATARAG